MEKRIVGTMRTHYIIGVRPPPPWRGPKKPTLQPWFGAVLLCQKFATMIWYNAARRRRIFLAPPTMVGKIFGAHHHGGGQPPKFSGPLHGGGGCPPPWCVNFRCFFSIENCTPWRGGPKKFATMIWCSASKFATMRILRRGPKTRPPPWWRGPDTYGLKVRNGGTK